MKKQVLSLTLVCCLAGLAGFQLPGIAAEPSTKNPSKKTEDATASKVRRLPTPFGMLGLNDGQREQIYAVQESYDERIEKLKQELKEVTQERDKKMEALLTPGQKTRLKEIRDEAKATAKKKSADDSK